MYGVIVTHGKTVEEAVLKAAKKFMVSKEEIDYEVVDEGYRSLLRTRPAVIQATLKNQSTLLDDRMQSSKKSSGTNLELKSVQQEKEVDIPSSLNKTIDQAPEGTVWVKDGEIYCKNGLNHFALLTPCEGLILTVNGQVTLRTVIVSEEDQIEVEIHNTWVESKFNITVTEDKMQVVLEIVPGYSINKYLKDQTPSRELSLEIVERKNTNNGITTDLVYEELKKLGVKIGINHDEIQRACKSQKPITCIIAKGIEPIPGLDGVFDFFSKRKKEEKDQFTLSDTIDWKERFSLPTVKAGDVIGQPISSQPGVNGRNVLGEDVLAPAVKELSILTSEGTTLFGTNQIVVATTSGRIKVKRRPNNTLCFSILPQYVHHGNVNIRTGNIRFHGDVYILGNVEEGMVVEAGGNLHITGSVTKATVRIGGDCVINGAIVGTVIVCGHSNLIWDNLLPYFKLLHEDLVKLINAAKQLETNRSFSQSDIAKMGLQPLLRLLTEVKFKEIPIRVREISTIIKNEKEKFDADTYQAIDFLEKTFLYYHPLIENLNQLESLVDYIETVISLVEYDSNKKMNIQVQSLTNSSINCAWDIVVQRFCYASNVYCKGGIKLKGVLRGGRVQAGDFVITGEIGSNGGSQTEVWITSDKGYVKADLVWPDTLIKISDSAIKLITYEKSVYARMNDRGVLYLR